METNVYENPTSRASSDDDWTVYANIKQDQIGSQMAKTNQEQQSSGFVKAGSRLAAVCLGLLCVLLLTAITVLWIKGLNPPQSLLFLLRGSLPLSVGIWRQPLGRPSDGNLILGTAPLASCTCPHPYGNKCYGGDMPHRLRATQR
ncbi:hypothetical protein MHYP_G00360230 [Metynnis hypsauchen]